MIRNLTIFNIIRWVAGLIVSLTKRLMDPAYYIEDCQILYSDDISGYPISACGLVISI